MGDIKQVFENITDFIDHVKSDSFKGDTYTYMIDCGGRKAEWYGISKVKLKPGESHNGHLVARLAVDGWSEGAKLLAQVQTSVSAPQAKSIRRRLRWSDQGDEISMQRVYAGNLDLAWQGLTRRSGNGPMRVRVIVDSIARGSLDSGKMRWRGVAAMRLTDCLVEAGYSVQVESAFKGTGGRGAPCGSGERMLRVVVKTYSAPLDLESLAATCALPGFFRALGHTWAGGSMSVPTLTLDDVADDSDKALAVIIPQSVCDAASASFEVDRVLSQLDPERLLEGRAVC